LLSQKGPTSLPLQEATAPLECLTFGESSLPHPALLVSLKLTPSFSFPLSGLDHSTIIYEAPDFKPFVRLAWNKVDPNYLATFAMDNSKLVILDVRVSDFVLCVFVACVDVSIIICVDYAGSIHPSYGALQPHRLHQQLCLGPSLCLPHLHCRR